MPLRILSGTRLSEQTPHERCGDSPAGVHEQVCGDGRGEHYAGHGDDRKDPAVAEKGQPEGAQQRRRRVEDEARLALIQAERLQAMVQVE